MTKAKWNSRYNYKSNDNLDTVDCSDNIIETVGYRDTKTQIEEFLIAGKTLQAVRNENYNTDEEILDENVYNESNHSDNELLQIDPLHNMQLRRLRLRAERIKKHKEVKEKVNSMLEHEREQLAKEQAKAKRKQAINASAVVES